MSKSDESPSSMGFRVTGTGPKRLELTDLGHHLPASGLIEIRFTNQDGKTEVWMVPNKYREDEESSVLGMLREGSYVKLAYIDNGVDSRLGLQRDRMDLMLRHIQHHEAELEKKTGGFAGVFEPQYVCTFEETLDGSSPA